MKQKIIAVFCVSLVWGITAQPAFANPELEAKVKMLEVQLQQLKALIVEDKKQREADMKTLVATKAKATTSNNSLSLSEGTTLTYGGFIKVNAMFDDYQDGATPSASVASRILVPSLIPVGDSPASEGVEFNSDVATSRVFFKTSTNTSVGTIKSHVELDFLSDGGDERISNSNNFRIRHAYLNWGYSDTASVLIGQSWSTFFNVGALPEAVEFIGPTSAVLLNRQQQIRWTKKTGNGSSFMFALENPSTSLADAGSGIAGSNFDDNAVPDIVTRFNGKSGKHSYAVSLLGREISYNQDSVDESDFGFALNLAGKWVLANGDDIKYSIAHGNLGRYIALNAFRDGGIDESGNLDLSTVTGGYVAYRHIWTDKLRSTIQYAYSSADLANGLSTANTSSVSNLNLNLIYAPTPKLTFGGAIIQADRELEDGQSGDLTRIQLTAKYGF